MRSIDVSALVLEFRSAVLEVMGYVIRGLGAGNDPRSVREQIIHLLERELRRLGQEEVEEQGVGEVADLSEDINTILWRTEMGEDKTHDEQVVIPIPHLPHRHVRNLSNHGVKRKADHRHDTHALTPRLQIKDLSWDNPAQRSARR